MNLFRFIEMEVEFRLSRGRRANLILVDMGDFKVSHKNEVVVLISLSVVVIKSFGYHDKRLISTTT